MKLRGFSPKSIKSYLYHASDYLSSGLKPQEYIIRLSQTRDPRTVNLSVSAIKFLFKNALKQAPPNIHYMKRPSRIPAVLTRDEILSLMSSISNTKHRLLLETIYGCGLRVSEATSSARKTSTSPRT